MCNAERSNRGRGTLPLTHAGDPLVDEILEQSVDDGVVSGVELVTINPNVEAQPVGIGVGRQLSGRAELFGISFAIPV